MKTLDEVIEIMTACIKFDADCSECPVLTSCTGRPWRLFDEDALTYLKKYRDLKATMDWHEEMERIRYRLMNPPLTWEELRQMQDKPVWWMHGEAGEWLTIYRVPTLGNGNDDVIYATTCSGVECWIYRKDMDKFQYYRKEKE